MKTYYRYPMKTLTNCRDLGGLPTEDGGVTRFGVLIRSELPFEMAPEDLALFRELNLTTSIDLRGDEEVVSKPSDFAKCDWVDYKHINVMSRQAAASSEAEKPKRTFSPADLFNMDWRNGYCGMVANKPSWIYEICEAVANAPGAVHFHCAAGKDRTGLFSMIILSICGVAAEDIAANYSLSECYLLPFYKGMLEHMHTDEYGVDDLTRGFFSTSHKTMRYVIDDLKEKYGSVVNYLKECGVTDEMIQKIKDKVVEY